MNRKPDIEEKVIAAQAVRTVPRISAEDVHRFLLGIDTQEPEPSYWFRDIPIWQVSPAEQGATGSPLANTLIPEGLSATTKTSQIGFSNDYLTVRATGDGGHVTLVAPLTLLVAILEDQGCTNVSTIEARVAANLLAGLSLAEMAEIDGVSYETRRNQFKSLASKVGLSRQQDVLRVLLQDMLLALLPATQPATTHEFLHDYADNFLPEGVRLSVLQKRARPDVRILDYGPIDGRPVLLLHPMIFPDITEDNIRAAVADQIRVIVPLRPGMLEPGARWQSHAEHMATALDALETAWSLLCGAPTPILALVSGGALATQFALRHPQRASSLTFAATCFSSGHYRSNSIYFGSSLAELALRNQWVMSKTASVLCNQFSRREKFEPTIRRIFSGSRADQRVLSREFAQPNGGARLMAAVLNSPESIKQDYFNQVHFEWTRLRDVAVPVQFVHGEDDSIHALSGLMRLCSQAGNRPLIKHPEVGHLMHYQHLDRLLADTANRAQMV